METPYPLYTLACPQVDTSAHAFIDGIRRQHDPQVDLVAPHFQHGPVGQKQGLCN